MRWHVMAELDTKIEELFREHGLEQKEREHYARGLWDRYRPRREKKATETDSDSDTEQEPDEA